MNAVTTEVTREIIRIESELPGPTVIAVAAIHGNEQAGIAATKRVIGRLALGDVPFRGEVIALIGNVGAVREKRRYINHDLNRVWSDAQIAAVESLKPYHGHDAPIAEHHEQRELLGAIRAAMKRARGPVYLIDLHSTSAHGVPFIACGSRDEQRKFVTELPLPIIVGLEDKVDGALSAYWNKNGCIAFTVEGGQHDDPGTVDNLESALLITLEAAGSVSRGALPDFAAARLLLDARRGDLPRVMEVVSRFAITPDQGFTMVPGFRNVDYARASQLLARDNNGEIRAESDGVIILPLYQGQGSDGFFWGRAVP